MLRTAKFVMLFLFAASGVLHGDAPSLPASAPAQQAGQDESVEVYVISAYYQTMVEECQLTPQQQGQLVQKLQAAQQAMGDWDKANSERKKELQALLVAAYKDKDKETVKTLASQLDEMVRTRRKLVDQNDDQILGILTADQRHQWESCLVYAEAMRALEGLDFNESQYKRIRNLCSRIAPKLMAAKGDTQLRNKIYDDLVASIKERVLTDAQRKTLLAKQPRPQSGPAASQPSAG